MSCPLWTNWSGGGITRPNSPFYPKLSRWSSQYQLPHPNLSGSSVAGNVVTPKRARLNPEKVEDLVVVKCNLRLLKGMGFMRK